MWPQSILFILTVRSSESFSLLECKRCSQNIVSPPGPYHPGWVILVSSSLNNLHSVLFTSCMVRWDFSLIFTGKEMITYIFWEKDTCNFFKGYQLFFSRTHPRNITHLSAVSTCPAYSDSESQVMDTISQVNGYNILFLLNLRLKLRSGTMAQR